MNKIYTTSGDKPVKAVVDLLRYIDPLNSLKKDAIIGIKPNLVCATPPENGATTHPEIVEGIILYLKSHGYNNIRILESSWIGDSTKRAFKVCGYDSISKKYGIPLIDLKDDEYTSKTYKGLTIDICNSVFEIDYLINVPLVKGHCQTSITCALKNLKGLIPDHEKRRFHTLGLHRPIAFLNKMIPQNLIIADAICPDPYFEEGGRPENFNQIFVASDPVLMDSYAAGMLGYEVEDIEYIMHAIKEGIGSPVSKDTEFICFNENSLRQIEIRKKENKFLNLIDEADACSKCYSNLVKALITLNDMNLTDKIAEQICIGQAFKDCSGSLGIGDCTSSFLEHLPGCPPGVDEIVDFLKNR